MHRNVLSAAPVSDLPATRGRNVVAVIGIDRYRHWPRLHNAVNDARGARDVFLRHGYEELVAPLFDDLATAEAIRRLVTDDLSELAPNDSLILFFAGHGHTHAKTFEDGHAVKTGYMVPVDADAPGGRIATWLRLDNWLSDVARLPARHILVILDACYSGIALGSIIRWRDSGVPATASLDHLSRRRSRKIITSALDDQRAMDSGPVPGHSLFTGCLIEGLTAGLAGRGRTVATGSEIGLYVQQRVTTYPDSAQTPDFGTLELDNRGELLIGLDETISEEVPPPPSQPPRPPPSRPRTEVPRHRWHARWQWSVIGLAIAGASAGIAYPLWRTPSGAMPHERTVAEREAAVEPSVIDALQASRPDAQLIPVAAPPDAAIAVERVSPPAHRPTVPARKLEKASAPPPEASPAPPAPAPSPRPGSDGPDAKTEAHVREGDSPAAQRLRHADEARRRGDPARAVAMVEPLLSDPVHKRAAMLVFVLSHCQLYNRNIASGLFAQLTAEQQDVAVAHCSHYGIDLVKP